MRKNGWLILSAFLGGILLANLSKKELLTTYGILNTYFLKQYSYQTVDCNSLFAHVLFERLKAAVMIFLLGKILNGKIFLILMECFVAATFGFLMVVAIVNLGVLGIAVTFAGMFPQWIFYIIALFLYLYSQQVVQYPVEQQGKMRLRALSAQAGTFLLLAFLFMIGVLAESYVNPGFFGKVIKII